MREYFEEYVKAELTELETRDVDTLYECILDNLTGLGLSESDKEYLYDVITRQVETERTGI